jgi:hypothetical protein
LFWKIKQNGKFKKLNVVNCLKRDSGKKYFPVICFQARYSLLGFLIVRGCCFFKMPDVFYSLLKEVGWRKGLRKIKMSHRGKKFG